MYLTRKQICNLRNAKYIIPAIYFIVILTIALTFRRIGDFGVETDFYWAYVNQAKSLQQGVILLDPFRGLVYPAVLSVFGLVFEMFTAGIIINVLCASISLYLIYIIIEKLSSGFVALGTMCLVLSNIWFIKYTYSVGTDMLFLVFFLATIYYALNNKWLLAGIFTALAYNTRYAGVSLIVGGIILLTLKYRKWK
jgi:hypothetical protein